MISEILLFLYVWISSFLIHEIMHIKGQGIFMTGTIDVWKYGMTVSPDVVEYPVWMYYSGGILSSLIMFILAYLTTGWLCWCFLTLGWVQLIYGIYEGYNMGNVKYRYIIYVTVILIMVVLWYMR